MPNLRYFEQAKNDLIEIKRYIASNESALRYMQKLRQECRRLATLPGMIGRSRPELMEGIRSIPSGNYVILFRYNGPYLEIISIIEGHRDIEELFSK